MNHQPTILFIPVSSPEGIGEYMRSLIIAKEICKQWPNADIHFIVSQQAPYANDCPFTTHTTPTSPTKHVKEVNQLIASIKPAITVFDASGRKSQLAAAKRSGSKVVFISQHKKKRSRGLKWGRLALTDKHWVVQPSFVLGDISVFEKLKLKLLNKTPPVNIGPVFTPVNKVEQVQILSQHQLEAGEYLLFNAGSGGHKIGEQLAADIYATTAERITQELGLKCVMVYGSNYPNKIDYDQAHLALDSLDNEQFIALVEAAKLVVISGGDSLLQTIAMKKPCLTTPVSKDQPPRICICANKGLAVAAATEAGEMVNKIKHSLENESLQHNLNNAGCNNGLVVALQDIKSLLEENDNA